MSGATHALVIDTRPVWESAPSGRLSWPLNDSPLVYVVAPLQRLQRLPQDALLESWHKHVSAKLEGLEGLAVVATSPASVEALQVMPLLSAAMVKRLREQGSQLFAVGAASARCLQAWAKSYDLHLDVVAPSDDSGVQAFMRLLNQDSKTNRLFVLLESSSNQPDLAQNLRAKGLVVERFSVYQRSDCALRLRLGSDDHQSLDLQARLTCAVVSSSALVDRALSGLQQAGLNPHKVHWFCHHSKINEKLQQAALPHIHSITDLSETTILNKVIELLPMND